MSKSTILLVIGWMMGVAQGNAQVSVLGSESSDRFTSAIRPLLQRYCGDCHAPAAEKTEFLWAKTTADTTKMRNSFAAVWQHIQGGTMPPADAEQPSATERRLIEEWIQDEFDFKPADVDRLSTYVIEIFEDSKGNLWFGTLADGVARYDGKSLAWFSSSTGLAGQTVTSVAEDSQGDIWIGTDGGVSKFDGQSFTTYSAAAGLPGTRCYLLVDRQGGVWVGTERGVFRYRDSKFVEFPVPAPEIEGRSWKVEHGKVWCLLEDRHGNIWLGRDGLGACRFDGKSFTHFTRKEGLCSNNVSTIVEDNAGNLWFGCLSSDQPQFVNDGGVSRFDGKSFVAFPEVKGLHGTDIYTIRCTRSGEVWIGATGIGAYRFDGSTFALFSQTDRPYWTRYFGLQSMLEDRQGRLWFGFSGGLFRFNGQTFENVGRAKLSGDTVSDKPVPHHER